MKKCFLSLLIVAAMLVCALPGLAEGGGVADSSDMTDVLDIVDENAVPVTADQLVDGTYAVSVDSSSSMFKVVGCELTVSDGALTAKLLMKSDSYSYMYAGTAEEAAALPLEEAVALEMGEDGEYSFTLPIEALDVGYTCAAYSARKELWYPRTLVFRADSLPLEAWNPDYLVTSETLSLADGEYTCEVALTGEGRAELQSPATLTVSGEACTAHITFNTARIDYALVGGERFEPVDTENGAAFDVPVTVFGKPITIVVDSTAIKPAVEVTYTMTFDETTLASVSE